MPAAFGTRLQIAGGVFVAFGLLIAAAALPALSAPLGLMADIVFWPVNGAPEISSNGEERLLAAIVGGLMVGWGEMLIMLGRGANVARATLIGGIAWFIVDSLGSVLAGAPLNVASNALFLALIIWAVLPGLGARSQLAAA